MKAKTKSGMKYKILWGIIIAETLLLAGCGVYIFRHIKCYHDRGKPRQYYYGPRGGKYYIDAAGRKKYVKAKESEKTENELLPE